MFNLYTLALAVCLGFSTQAAAITFQFQVDSVTGGEAEFSSIVELTELGVFSAEGDLGPGGFTNLETTDRFLRFDFAYSFAVDSVAISMTPDRVISDRVSASLAVEDISFFVGGGTFFSHVFSTVGIFGSSPGGFLDLWTIQFGSDDPMAPQPVITGRFVAVPEPGAIGLVALGLVGIGVARSRSRRHTKNRHLLFSSYALQVRQLAQLRNRDHRPQS